MSALLEFQLDYPEGVWQRDVFDRPWLYDIAIEEGSVEADNTAIDDIPEIATYFYNEEDNVFWDEMGYEVNIGEIVKPHELYLFKALGEDMWLLRKSDIPWEPELVCIGLVYPENLEV